MIRKLWGEKDPEKTVQTCKKDIGKFVCWDCRIKGKFS